MTTRPTDSPLLNTATTTSPPTPTITAQADDAPGAAPVHRPQLALHGGPRAVTTACRDRWRRIHLRDIYRIARYAMRDVNTLTSGGCIEELETRFADLTRTPFAIAMNSGTATLHSAFYAAGVKPGHEVIVPTYTFYASAAPILQLGGTPVFCDVDPETLTADPDDVEKRITPNTRAICVVHVWGNPAKMDRFVEIARRHKLTLIEDCSHAHGASYRGIPVGGWGDIGCFSLQGAKPVSGGELGVAVTSNPTLYDHMLALGHFGRVGSEQKAATYAIDQLSLGFKYRPHPYAVLLALGSLDRLDQLNQLRRRNYALLAQQLRHCRVLRPINSYPGSQRGGLLEFIFRFHPEHANQVSAGLFVKAAAAEGVPIQRDRYTLLGRRGRLLHELPLFNALDYAPLGGFIGGGHNRYRDNADARPHLPQAEAIADDLVTLPPLTDVKEEDVRAIGRALRKVADALPTITDHRTGA